MRSPPLPSALLCAALSCLAALATASPQASTEMSNGSALAVDGSAAVIEGSLGAVAAGGAVVVASVEVAGDASLMVLTSAADGTKSVLRLSGQAARDASAAVGGSVQLVALASGTLLIAAGRVLAFVPNRLGRALLHSSAVAERG